MIALVALAALAGAPETCERLCLAGVSTFGVADEERAALADDVARRLQVERCAAVVDEACHAEDACLAGAAASGSGPGVVAVRVVRVGDLLRAEVAAATKEGVVRRTAAAGVTLDALPLDPSLADGAGCAPPPPPRPPVAPPPPVPPEPLVGAPAVVAGSGVALGVLGAASVAAGALALEQPALDGGAKSALAVVGWAGLGAVAVGAAAALAGGALFVVDVLADPVGPAPAPVVDAAVAQGQ